MVNASFEKGNEIKICGVWQYDYGQLLEISGIETPDGTAIHFAQNGKTIEGTIRSNQVEIPDYFLQFYSEINAYIYLEDGCSGETVAKASIKLEPREKPPDYIPPEEPSYTRLLPEGWAEDDYLTVKDGKLVWVKLDAEFASNEELVQVAEAIPQFATMKEIEDMLNMEE
ncbi:hypothetical protein [Lacrimispora indolis]|uniref:hypothetical protein n=1 Tax=Lacrimispora indolis TaxID=69825 RepID=UPI0003F99A3F|nr:hypothetical protein [[Clostridium] methoxybenzovorans]